MALMPALMSYDLTISKSKEIMNSNGQKVDSALEERIQENWAQLTGYFTENRGQLKSKDIQYYTNRDRVSVGFSDSTVLFNLRVHEDEDALQDRLLDSKKPIELEQSARHHEADSTSDLKGAMFQLRFEGANHVSPVGYDELSHRSNYFIGNIPSEWRTDLRNFREIVYTNVYDGIDLIYRIQNGWLKYEFVVNPYKDPEIIKLAYEGVEDVAIEYNGNLLVRTVAGDFMDTAPYIYQVKNGVQYEVTGRYDLIETNIVGFLVEDYDASLPLIIDPEIRYSTFVGGSNDDLGESIAVDANGNIYVTGSTWSSDFPTTIGAYNDEFNGMSDVFVLKLIPAGNGVDDLVYSTFVGGSDYDVGFDIAVGANGETFVTGWTYSSNFPITANAYDDLYSGLGDVFVFVLFFPAVGPELSYSSYFGDSGPDSGESIAVDTNLDAYVTGSTYSSEFPTTNGAYDNTHNGNRDVFVFKLDFLPTPPTLEYSTFVGGPEHDFGESIVVDASGITYVTGYTYSLYFPTTSGAYDNTYNGMSDVFVFKLNPAGNGEDDLVYSTFIGEAGREEGFGIALDASSNTHVTGWTESLYFPTTSNAYDDSYNGGSSDAFFFKLNPAGNGVDDLVYSTFMGGSFDEHGYDIALDAYGNVHVAGWTSSSNFPTTSNAYDDSYNYGGDVFVFILNSLGTDLIYSTFIGGTSGDSGNGISLDANGDAHIAGDTSSSGFPTTPGAFSEDINGGIDVFIFKFGPELYSTYVGEEGYEVGRDIAVDVEGNAYVTGRTNSIVFPENNDNNGKDDVFVFKLSSDGSDLIYSTLVGGEGNDWGLGIAIDTSRNAYVTGWTDSQIFPINNNNYGAPDAFVFKLSSDGSSLIYSILVGGPFPDQGQDIVVDSYGNAYVTGITYSTFFPAYYFIGLDFSEDNIFVFKLNPEGSAFGYSTIVGGSLDDMGKAITIDVGGNAYITGYTDSPNFPADYFIGVAFGGDNVFVFKLNPEGSSLDYCTIVGGSLSDWGESIAVDVNDYAYVTGWTESPNFPMDNMHIGGIDAFVFKLNFGGFALIYGIFVGGDTPFNPLGNPDDFGNDIEVDANGNAYVTGGTCSSDFPSFNNPFQQDFGGGNSDVFVFKVNSEGTIILYSTYIGGSGDDLGFGIELDALGYAYITGVTNSFDFPVLNAYDPDFNDPWHDVFVFKRFKLV